MTQVADPYQEWLGVERDDEQETLTAYDLLGLRTYEDNVARIRAAADRQRLRLERRRPGADSTQWERLRGELEQAIRTLLEPSRKAELDLRIKRQAVVSDRPPAPTPPAEAEGEIGCRGCEQPNAAQKRYCSHCGEALWVECLACETVIPVSEKFCGGCGENQEEVARRLQEKNQKVIDRARALGEQHRYGEAVATLSPLIQQSHRGLRQQVERAGELMDTLLAERDQWKERARQWLEQARRAAERTEYAEAVALLHRIPEPFRDEEIEQALREYSRQADEVGRLKAEIAEAIERRDINAASDRVERLLAIDPDDAEADRIGRSLAASLQKAAAKQLARHQYTACRKLLGQIPERYRDERIQRRLDQLDELCWLHTSLRTARYADATLQDVARRLVQAVPQDETAARLRKQLDQRIEKYRQSANGKLPGPIPWVAPSGPSFVGVPLDWLTTPQRLQITDAAVKALWLKRPGHFFVAAGLALRGLGRASLEMDLAPKKKSGGVLGSLSLPLGRRPQTTAAWGVDVGRSSLKAVRLALVDDAVVVDKCVWIDAERDVALREGDGSAASSIGRVIKRFRESETIPPGEPVTISVPNLRLLGRFLRIPRSDGKRFQQLLEYEVRHRIPVPMEELCWDHHVVPDEEEEAYREVPQAVLVLAAKQAEVRRWLAHFEEAELPVQYVQSDAVALHNWLRFDQGASPSDAAPPDPRAATVLFDVGSDNSQVVVSWPGSFWFRTLASGGDDVTRTLVKNFQLTHRQAEQLKHQPTKAKRLSPVFRVIEGVNGRLRTQLKQSLEAFAKDFPEMKIERAMGVGGGFQMHGLLNDLYRVSDD